MPDYKTHDPKGWCGDPKRGAAMGRPTIKGSPDYPGQLFLRQVHIDNGGYDPNGTYFGLSPTGATLYWYASDDGLIDGVLWSNYRKHARLDVLELYPKAKVRR